MREKGRYDTMQVCLNGHLITGSYETKKENRKDYCTLCGEKNITNCPNCNKKINGHYYLYNNFFGRWDKSNKKTIVPEACEYCGYFFPWKNKKGIKNEKEKKIIENKSNRKISFLAVIVAIFTILGVFVAIIVGWENIAQFFKNIFNFNQTL